ncbi:hypothetical protein [Oceanobacter kriegii]|uniref:hypothetical protein n=1 Tax=Oceanobacter kriegii TaxID=64972 RepID=UPI000417AF12|nr:hypothetical protein [Oceanobacter kriegii]
MRLPNPVQWLRQVFNLPDTPDLQWIRTETHKRRLEQVKTGWIIAGLLMLGMDNNAAVFMFGFFCIFLTFAFLERDTQEES